RADIVAAPLHLLSKREAVIDYIIPWTGYSGIIILAKQEARQYFNFASAFTLGLWSTVGLTFILSCFMIFLFVKVLRSARTDNGQNVEGHNNKINFQDVVWFLISSSAFEVKTKEGISNNIRLQHPQQNSKTPKTKTQNRHAEKATQKGQGAPTHNIETSNTKDHTITKETNGQPVPTLDGHLPRKYQKRADLITVALHLMRSREAVIDYILPWTGYSGLTILAKQDQRQRFNFWNAFTPGLWLTLIAVFILSFLLLALFGKVLSRCHVSADDNSKGSISEYNTFKRAFWFLTSSCAFEGTGEVPYGHSVRTVIASIWIFIQLFMSIFLGEVAAFLMSSGMKSQITSLDDLIEQHAINFSCLRDTSIGEHIYDMSKIENYFDKKWTRNNLDNETFSSADKIVWTNPLTFKYTKLWERSVKTGFINTTVEAISKIKEGNFMLVSDSAVAEFVAGDDCDLKTIGRKISARPYGFAIRKHSSIKANISKA
ncbi:hypothetical protein FSP39_010224, partial [Pinctada imbricata]